MAIKDNLIANRIRVFLDDFFEICPPLPWPFPRRRWPFPFPWPFPWPPGPGPNPGPEFRPKGEHAELVTVGLIHSLADNLGDANLAAQIQGLAEQHFEATSKKLVSLQK